MRTAIGATGAILTTHFLHSMKRDLVMPYKRPDLWQAATMKIPGMWLVSILGLVTSLLLLGYLIQESTAQFGAVVVWVGVGATLYHFTRNNHQLECKLIREAESGIRAAVDAEGR